MQSSLRYGLPRNFPVKSEYVANLPCCRCAPGHWALLKIATRLIQSFDLGWRWHGTLGRVLDRVLPPETRSIDLATIAPRHKPFEHATLGGADKRAICPRHWGSANRSTFCSKQCARCQLPQTSFYHVARKADLPRPFPSFCVVSCPRDTRIRALQSLQYLLGWIILTQCWLILWARLTVSFAVAQTVR